MGNNEEGPGYRKAPYPRPEHDLSIHQYGCCEKQVQRRTEKQKEIIVNTRVSFGKITFIVSHGISIQGY